jgi:hypothetical protein
LQEWKSQEAQSLGVVFALTELIKPLSNCPGLSEAHQLEFMEMIKTSDLPPKEIHSFEVDPFILLLNADTWVGKKQTLSCPTNEKSNRGLPVRRR